MLRGASSGKWQITLADAGIAAIAVGLSLILTGKIRKLVIGKEGITLETAEKAILSSAKQPIKMQVNELPVSRIVEADKAGISKIREMVERKVQGLKLKLGRGVYYDGSVLREYLEGLSPYDFFQYVILLDRDGSLFGMVEARNLLEHLARNGSGNGFAVLADQLNAGTEEDQSELAQLPGFVPASKAVTNQTDKRAVLARMEEFGRDWLPVVSEQRKFEGIVERSRLTASMILDITKRLEGSE
jgi:hypothetical protein